MLLPYASYLRVYEPLERAMPGERITSEADQPGDAVATMTLAREQQTVLRMTVASSGPAAEEDLAGGYLLRREGRLYMCAVDLALRSWIALTTFVEDTDHATQGLFFLRNHAEHAETQLTTWRLANPLRVPHIRGATWGVPRTWFLLVDEDDREEYDVGGLASVRFRTPMPAARTRVAAAHSQLGELIDDEDLMDELDDLESWLTCFSGDSVLELDYAGVALLLGRGLDTDRSAAEIRAAVVALERKDFAAAGEAYRSFVERWRVVNAMERAN